MIITLILILLTVVLQATTRLKPYVIYMGAVAVLLLTDVLTPQEAFSGFASPSVVSIGILFIVCEGLVRMGVIRIVVDKLLGSPKTLGGALVRLMAPTALISTIILDSALVSLLVGGIVSWAKKLKVSASKLLIPMSFAICMGGVATLMGKVPNMVIAGSYSSGTGEQMSFFSPFLFAVVCMAAGFVGVLLISKWLPERKSAEEALQETSDFLAEFIVPTDSRLVGQTIEESQVANLGGAKLLRIIHFDREVVSAIHANDDYIMGGDRLVYVGKVGDILEQKSKLGLAVSENHVYTLGDTRDRHTATAMVTIGSQLVGRTWSEVRYEQERGVSLIAVSRRAELIDGSPYAVKLAAGDTLLVEYEGTAGKIQSVMQHDLQFYESEGAAEYGWRTWAAVAIVVLMVLLMAFNVMPLAKAATLAAVLILLTKCCSLENAYKSINWQMLLMLAGAIVLGTAVSKTGLALSVTNLLLDLCGGQAVPSLIAFSLVSLLMANMIGNTAVAAIFAPIAVSVAAQLNCSPMAFCLMLMYSTTYCFATPVGSSSNVVVYFAVGYKFADFVKIGLPIILLTLPVALLFVIMMYSL